MWNRKRPQLATAILRKKNKGGENTIPDIELYSKAIKIKTAWYWHKNRHIHPRDRTEYPEIYPSHHTQLIFDKGDKSIQWSKNSLFNKYFLGILDR